MEEHAAKRQRLQGACTGCPKAQLQTVARLAEIFCQMMGRSDAPQSVGEYRKDWWLSVPTAEALDSMLAVLPDSGVDDRPKAVLEAFRLSLQTSAANLQNLLDKNSLPEVPPYCKAEASVSYAKRVLAYAHKLSYTTFAPPGYVAGQTILRHFEPPAPQDWQLRSSKLHDHAGVKAMPAIGKESTDAGMPQYSKEASPGETAIPPMPLGWKPGDPLPDMQDVPARWGLGDQAPATESLAQPQSIEVREGQQAADVALREQQSAPLHRAFDFILNPDLEEADEDFSSDEDSEE